MELKLLHLYPDVMNLYGEYANVAVLARCLRDLGCTVSVDTLSLYEEKDISGYDFYYLGAGTERNQKLVLPHLLAHRADLEAACESGKVLLFTGTGFELLGAGITDADGKAFEGLHIGEFQTVESTRRITGDCIADCKELPLPLVGFVNKCSRSSGITSPLFTLRMGFGNEKERGAEGFRKNNCFGTHITGPILAKNPAMLRYIAGLLGAKTPEHAIYPNMEKAYEVTAEELQKRLEATK